MAYNNIGILLATSGLYARGGFFIISTYEE